MPTGHDSAQYDTDWGGGFVGGVIWFIAACAPDTDTKEDLPAGRPSRARGVCHHFIWSLTVEGRVEEVVAEARALVRRGALDAQEAKTTVAYILAAAPKVHASSRLGSDGGALYQGDEEASSTTSIWWWPGG